MNTVSKLFQYVCTVYVAIRVMLTEKSNNALMQLRRKTKRENGKYSDI